MFPMCLSRVALWLRVLWSLEWLCSSALSISIGISAVCCGKHAKRTNSALRGGCCSEREKTAPPGTAVSKPAHKSTARTLLYALFFSASSTVQRVTAHLPQTCHPRISLSPAIPPIPPFSSAPLSISTTVPPRSPAAGCSSPGADNRAPSTPSRTPPGTQRSAALAGAFGW